MKSLPALESSLQQLEKATWLDPTVKSLSRIVKKAVPQRDVRDLLHGVPFGHALHPVMAQITLGAWSSAAVLDLLPGNEKASAVLIGTGLASVLPTAAAGLMDWSKAEPGPKRTGLVHAAVNVTATGIYAISLIQRCTGHHSAGKIFGALGFAAVSAGGFLGGHLAYRQGVGISRVVEIPNQVPSGWQRITSLETLTDGELERRLIGEVPLVLLRKGEEVHALANTCSHLTGPLNEGKLFDGDDPCVECPWHKSVFSLRTGEVIHGPATAPQPHFETRVIDGHVEARLKPAHS
ncbi:MAG TPA: Rieske 2Fe-2S domain-containing protein [Arthrobacter sp.]|nr:Rieske 2Fe-2S domain-containing protein [Arthrobacter sp.]